MIKKKLLILYDWFYPGFNAGGPIQSLTNLALTLTDQYEVYVITSAFDLNATVSYHNVGIDTWNDVTLPGGLQSIKVFYSGKRSINKNTFNNLVKDSSPDIVYLNGIFSYRFFLLPLLCLNKNKTLKIVVCPRGMLKKGALSGKAFKKKIYISCLKMSRSLSKVYWHATSVEELNDITKHFPLNKGIFVAPNIPKKPKENISFIEKEAGQLKLIYLSLINEHKNLLLLLHLIKELDLNISLHIYGPVIEENYWKECEILIKQIARKVQYKGAVEPVYVQELVAQYHSLILLTKGENFGHALYESLSVGRPVITSYFTPWKKLSEESAGENVDIENLNECKEKISRFVKMPQHEFDALCSGAHNLSTNYYKNLEAIKAYSQVFAL